MSQRAKYLIINGDARRLGLADKSVHCVVTSPPYFALRDYGLSQWVGGDEGCEHNPSDTLQKRGLASSTLKGGLKATAYQQEGYSLSCLKCGATRAEQQLGLEAVPDCLGWATGNVCGECYVCHTVQWAREVWRVLRDDGTFWLNLGDSYNSTDKWGGGKNGNTGKHVVAEGGIVHSWYVRNKKSKIEGLKPKDLIGMPWRVAFALQKSGWYLRQDIIWAKGVSGQDSIWENAYEAAKREGLSDAAARRIADAVAPYVGNCMPESVTDRCTKSHEYVFLFSKSERYFFDSCVIREKQTDSSRERAKYGWYGNTNDNSNGARSGSSFKQMAESGAHNTTIPEDGFRNRRSVWTVNTSGFSGEHFAAFPPKLVEPCVLAGTSAHGCCPECGAPWKRIIVKTDKVASNHNGSLFGHGKTGAREGGEHTQSGERFISKTMGWQPACKCGCEEVVPCLVLDPFSGTGTVGEVCAQHNRSYVGNELNPQYIKLQQARVHEAVAKYTAQRRQKSLFEAVAV